MYGGGLNTDPQSMDNPSGLPVLQVSEVKPVQFLDLVASGRADEYLVSQDESPVTCILYLLVVIAHHDRIGAVNEKNTFINYWS